MWRATVVSVLSIHCACIADVGDDDPSLEEAYEELTVSSLAPVADAYVRSGSYQSQNFGTATTLNIKLSSVGTDDFNRHVYLKFDLGSVTNVASARLRLYGSDGSAPESVRTEVRAAPDTAWSETGITWANRPGVGGALGSVPLAATPAWHEWDVTPYLQAEKAAGRNLVTLVLINTVASTTGAPAFTARESSTNRPELRIESGAGATIPWRSYEAEAGARASTATLQTGTSWGQVAFEARGKQTVVLDAAGEYVQWTNVAAASHATLRFSLPDATSGSLGLFVNNAQAATLALSSARLRESKPQGGPPGATVRFFDEVTVAVPGGIPAGATVKVQKLSSDTVPYSIDYLEVETAPPPLARPDSTWVSVSGTDGNAIRAAVTTASNSSKKVWLPAGTYTVTDTIILPAGVQVRGAGMWHTLIKRNNTTVNARLFQFSGTNSLRDVKIVSNQTTLIGQNVAIRGDSQGNVVENVWTEYIPLYLGFNATNVTIRNNRVRNTYKDSIHLARASVGNLVENNTIRNSGDDSVALVSYDTTGMANNTIRRNTSELGYWGRGLTIIGGTGNRIEQNRVVDQVSAGVLIAVETYSGLVTPYATGWTVRDNVLVRCGNQVNAAYGAAFAVYASVDRPISGYAENNQILGSVFDGASLRGHVGDAGTSTVVYFRNNTIMAPTTSGYVRKRTTLSSGSNCVHTPNTDI